MRIIEADEDPLLYEIGHIRNAVKLDWHVDVQDPVRRDFVSKADFEALMSRYGVTNETTIVLYGDKSNWYAAYSFWLFRMYGHRDLRLMNGGRAKWEAEGRAYVRDVPAVAATAYTARDADVSIRAFRRQVEDVVAAKSAALIDVRSADEYTGRLLHMINYPQEGAQRGGHIPGARSIPWATAAAADGTFKSAEELREHLRRAGHHARQAGDDVLPHRRAVGAYLVRADAAPRLPDVRNYDGSWTEWGNLVGAPIEKGE